MYIDLPYRGQFGGNYQREDNHGYQQKSQELSLWDSLGVLALGILIGILLTCLYRKIVSFYKEYQSLLRRISEREDTRKYLNAKPTQRCPLNGACNSHWQAYPPPYQSSCQMNQNRGYHSFMDFSNNFDSGPKNNSCQDSLARHPSRQSKGLASPFPGQNDLGHSKSNSVYRDSGVTLVPEQKQILPTMPEETYQMETGEETQVKSSFPDVRRWENNPEALLALAPDLDPDSITFSDQSKDESLNFVQKNPEMIKNAKNETPTHTNGLTEDTVFYSCKSLAFRNKFGIRNVLSIPDKIEAITDKLSLYANLQNKNNNSNMVQENEKIRYKMTDLVFPNADVHMLFRPTSKSKVVFVQDKALVYDCKILDSRGGLLYLENLGVSLLVPAGAISPGESRLVTLVVNWNPTDNPCLNRNETFVSPVVYYGSDSPSFVLKRPCLLKFKHCAYEHSIRYAQIKTCQTDFFGVKVWQDFGQDYLEDRQHDTSCFPLNNASITADECQVEVSKFGLYTCVLKSGQRSNKKRLQVAVFKQVRKSREADQNIRVYFLNMTPCALQWAVQTEADVYRLVCHETMFLFTEGEDMKISLSSLPPGWEMVYETGGENIPTSFVSIPFEEIWSGHCPFITLTFKGRHSIGKMRSQGVLSHVETVDIYNKKNSKIWITDDIKASNVFHSDLKMTSLSNEPKHKFDIIVRFKLFQTGYENESRDVNLLLNDFVTSDELIPEREQTIPKILD